MADLGATNARFSILRKGRLSDVYQFACDDFKNPYDLIEGFVHTYAPEAKYILTGVPGPVMNNKVCWTNRRWSLDGNALKKKLSLKKVILVNDLMGQGAALRALSPKDLVLLNQNKKQPHAPAILINVGTGLGACFIVDNHVYSAEYGQNVMIDGSTIESVVSGPAFKRLYQTLSGTDKMISAIKIAEACAKGDKIAQETYRQFYVRLARVSMNFALITQARGGVYLCGGILDKHTLKQMKFADLFCHHDKMNKLLKTLPLIYIERKDFAFIGLKVLAKEYGLS